MGCLKKIEKETKEKVQLSKKIAGQCAYFVTLLQKNCHVISIHSRKIDEPLNRSVETTVKKFFYTFT